MSTRTALRRLAEATDGLVRFDGLVPSPHVRRQRLPAVGDWQGEQNEDGEARLACVTSKRPLVRHWWPVIVENA